MANFRFGGSDRGIALNIAGELSGRVPGSRVGSWLTYGELRRLTMRGSFIDALIGSRRRSHIGHGVADAGNARRSLPVDVACRR